MAFHVIRLYFEHIDECQILYIWALLNIQYLGEPLALLFYDIFVSFGVLVCFMSLRENCGLRVKISKGIEDP
jgi:hypothetical protein